MSYLLGIDLGTTNSLGGGCIQRWKDPADPKPLWFLPYAQCGERGRKSGDHCGRDRQGEADHSSGQNRQLF